MEVASSFFATDVADSRRAETWEDVEGRKTARGRLVTKGYWYPDLRDGKVDIAGRVGRRSSHQRVVSSGALRRWRIWSLDIKNALLEAD